MIIPRRDLLTGSVLVLAASASGCGKGKGIVPVPAPALTTGCGASPTLFRTQFVADFTTAFIGDPTKIKDPGQVDLWPAPGRIWPVTGQNRNDIATDYATFVNVLMLVGYVGGTPPTAVSGSLADRIGKFLIAQNWPAGTTVPPEYDSDRRTAHLAEIDVILDRLLKAIYSYTGDGSGGGPGRWPPH